MYSSGREYVRCAAKLILAHVLCFTVLESGLAVQHDGHTTCVMLNLTEVESCTPSVYSCCRCIRRIFRSAAAAAGGESAPPTAHTIGVKGWGLG